MSHPYGPTRGYPPQDQQQPPYLSPEQPESFFHQYRILFLVLGLVLGFGLTGVVAFALAGNAASAVVQTVPSAEPSITQAPPDGVAAPAPASTPATPAPSPAKTIIIERPAPVQQAPAYQGPSGLRDIGGGVWASSNTSTPFAQAIVSSWQADPVANVKYVSSPVTGKTYSITYQVVGAGTVIATGGTNVYVQF